MYCVVADPENGILHEYSGPVRVERTYSPSGVPSLLARVSSFSESERLYAVGYVSYEAAPGFDHAHAVKVQARESDSDTESGFPLACFALYASRRPFPAGNERGTCAVSAFVPEIGEERYLSAVAEIKRCLLRGDAYQVNMTFRMRARYFGDALGWFLDRASAGHGAYAAFLRDGPRSLASLSPELFFALSPPAGDNPRENCRGIVLKPMKGTARAENGRAAEAEERLRNDPKNKAENLMITDMIRNDVGKIARAGSVGVPELFGTESFPTLVQMTSTVTATTSASVPKAFGALFPCASITGAPKISSMRIIKRLETSPRGPYTGAIGVMRPDGSANFSVAIRTAVFDERSRSVEYGTGSGIVWGSNAREEWNECMLKSAILGSSDGFYVFESLLLEEGRFYLLDRHLARFSGSLSYFGLGHHDETDGRFGFPGAMEALMERIRIRLDEIARANAKGNFKVRIAVRADGSVEASAEPLAPLPSPYRIALATAPVDSGNPFLAHKTSVREPIERALREMREANVRADDVLMVNGRGELTESSRANIVLEIDGTRYTPPLDSGILPGVFRAELVETKRLVEKTLRPEDFVSCDRVFIVNSVRRFVECVKVFP